MRASRFFRESAVLERLTGSDAYTGDTFASPVAISVRWRFAHELVRNAQGQEVVASAHLSTLAGVGLGDRVTDPFGGARRIITVAPKADVRGRFSHTVAGLV